MRSPDWWIGKKTMEWNRSQNQAGLHPVPLTKTPGLSALAPKSKIVRIFERNSTRCMMSPGDWSNAE